MVEHARLEQLKSAVRAGDHEEVARIIERNSSVLLRTDTKALQHAITTLPDAIFDEHPVLGLISESFRRLIGRARDRGDKWLAQAIELFDGPRDERFRLCAGMAAVHSLKLRGRFVESAELGRRVAELAEELHDAVPSEGPSEAAVHLYAGLSCLLACDGGRAEYHLHAAYRRTAPFANIALDAAGKLAFLCALRGEPGPAQAWIDRAEEVAPEAEDWWLRSQEDLIVDVAHALLAIDRLDCATYHRHTRNAIRFPTETWAFLLYAHARAALFLGNQRGVLEQLQAHRDEQPNALPEGSLPRILFDTAQADLHLSLGNYDEARKLVDPDRLLNGFGGDPLERTTAARLCMLTRRYDQAEQLTDHTTWPADITRRGQIHLSLLNATAKLHRDAPHDELQQVLRRAAAQMAGLHQPWLFTLATADRELINLLPQTVPETADLIRTLDRNQPVRPFAPKETAPLSPRERIILEHLARPLTGPEIAALLYVSASTVKNQCNSLYRKLGATSRAHAVQIAYATGLLERRTPSTANGQARSPSDAKQRG